jgi:hypothetical protein
MSKAWISKAIKKPGQLHRDLGVPQGQRIPVSRIRAAAKGSGKTAQRARFALTLRHLNPWEVVHDQKGYWVVKKDTGEKVHKQPHKTAEEAEAHVKALYAAEGMESDMDKETMMKGAPKGEEY